MNIIRLIASVTFAAILSACVTTEYSVTQRGDFPEFRRSLSNTSYGYQVVPDPTGSAPVPVVERFEVQPGDCWHNEASDDCSTDRERSELTQRGARYSDQFPRYQPDADNICAVSSGRRRTNLDVLDKPRRILRRSP